MRRNNLIKHGLLKKVIIFAMAMMVVSSPIVYKGSFMTTRAAEEETITLDGDNKSTEEKVAEKEINGDYDNNNPSDPASTTTETYTDGTQVEASTVTPDQTLDHTETVTQVAKDENGNDLVETHYYVTDQNGEKIQVEKVDENGNKIIGDDGQAEKVDLEVNADTVQAEEVKVVSTAADSESQTAYDYAQLAENKDIVYGHYDENGDFVQVPAGETPVEGLDQAYANITVVKNADGSNVAVNQDVADVLTGVTTDSTEYTRETIYYVAGEDGNIDYENGLSLDDIKAHYKEGEYRIDETTGALAIMAKQETDDNGENYYAITVDGEEKKVSSDMIATVTTYQIKTSDDKVLCEVDATAAYNIKAAHYTTVEDKYVVKDKNNKDVYFTAEDWAIATGYDVTYEKVVKNYYVTESKYQQSSYPVTVGGTAYTINVNFWTNDYARLDPDHPITVVEQNGAILVTVPYQILKENGLWELAAIPYTQVVQTSQIGPTNQATVSVKYTADLTRVDLIGFETEVQYKDTVIDGTHEKPINVIDESGKYTGNYRHVDVLVTSEIKVQDTTGKIHSVDAEVSNLTIKAYYFNKKTGQVEQFTLPYNEGKADNPSYGNSDGRYFEFCTFDNEQEFTNDKGEKINYKSILANYPVEISATINYKDPISKEPLSFNYIVNVYPTSDNNYNQCKYWTDGGFDYKITAEQLAVAMTRNHYKADSQLVYSGTPTGTTPEYAAPIPTPTPTPTPGGGGTTTTTTPTTTTITTAPVALAATPAGQVLGATRDLTTIADDPTALAATPEEAVLGVERNPQTDDSTNRGGWLFGLLTSCGAFVGWSIKNRKEKKEV